MTLAVYGDSVMPLALRGLEGKTLDPNLAGWRKQIVPTLGHLPLRMITNGAVDRAIHGWIAEQCDHSTVKNSLAVLARIMGQAVRDGIMDRNPARVIGGTTGAPKTSSTIHVHLPCPTGRPCASWRKRWSPGRPIASTAGVMSSSFVACTAARIGGYRASGAPTSTGTHGPGRSDGRRHQAPTVSSTRAPRASGPAPSPLSKKSDRSSNDASKRSAMTRRHASSPACAAAGSPRRYRATRPIETRSSPSSAMSICAATTWAIPA
jgi:hypothetical protein